MRAVFQPRYFAALVLLACLLNGTPFLIGRIGLLDPITYMADRQRFCPSSGPPAGLVSACAPVRPVALSEHKDGFERLNLQRLHAPLGYWRLLKALRLLLLLGCPLLVLWGILQGLWPWTGWRPLLPALPLLVSSAIALLIALPQAPLNELLFSLRSIAWLPLLLLSGPISQRPVLAQLARAMALLILLQIPVMLLEAIWGLPMSFGPPAAQLAQATAGLPTRLVGTFILPNGLGVAMVSLLGFCMAYLPQRRALMLLAVATLPIVLLARSGTGLFMWAVLMAFWTNRSWRLHLALKLIGLMLLSATTTVFPLFLGRPDLWQSVLGRLRALYWGITSNSSLWQWLFGQGLFHGRSADSLPTHLLLVGGLLALIAFYGLLVWAWCYDRQARPFLLVTALGSLTLNIVEVFPVNFLLALSINHILTVHWPEPEEPSVQCSPV